MNPSGQQKGGAKAPPPPALPPISEDTLRQMLSTHHAKIALEMKHAEISLRELDHNQKLADKSIEAQAEDRMDQRRLARTMHTQRVVLVGIALGALLVFVLVAMYMDKDQLAHDILKLILGGVGGYGIRAATEKRKSDEGSDKD